jgi:hypothetical protein
MRSNDDLADRPVLVAHELDGIHALDERYPFFESLDNLFMVEPVGGRIEHGFPVVNPGSSP